MTTDERQQRMVERIQEDETLRGDLEDDAATALVDWASKRAAAAAADAASSDAAVEAQVQAIRQAARAAALSGETTPKQLIALAAARLTASKGKAAAEAPATPAEPAADAAPAASATPAVAAAPAAASPPATDVPSSPSAEQATGAAPKPAGKRARRKRSRLARFFKHVLGGR